MLNKNYFEIKDSQNWPANIIKRGHDLYDFSDNLLSPSSSRRGSESNCHSGLTVDSSASKISFSSLKEDEIERVKQKIFDYNERDKLKMG